MLENTLAHTHQLLRGPSRALFFYNVCYVLPLEGVIALFDFPFPSRAERSGSLQEVAGLVLPFHILVSVSSRK